MAIAKYFIKKGSDTAKDLYATYRLYILESKGLWDLPTRKEAYAENGMTRTVRRCTNLSRLFISQRKEA